MQQLTTPPASTTSAVASTSRMVRDVSTTPSPPSSESYSPSSSTSFNNDKQSGNTFVTEASDSSAGSSSESTHKTTCRRPVDTNKRVLSEGDVIAPLPAKRSCNAIAKALRKRSVRFPSSASDSTTNPFDRDPRLSSVNAWKRARQQRQCGTRSPLPSSPPQPHVTPSKAASPIIPTKQPEVRSEVLPELRLLSATRTAPIGWSSIPQHPSFAPKMIEVYDERDASRAPERQRFWPIIDAQLDYTGARMLSLSSASPHQPLNLSRPRAKYDEPLSPKSTLPAHYGATSSGSDASPLTPDALPRPINCTRRQARGEASAYAKNRTRTESQREAKLPLSPKTTLGAMIDFTRAQAAQRNTYGQPLHTPLPAQTKGAEAYAPPRIPPKSKQENKGQRDYFGHWEVYLCNYGRESRY